MKKYTIDRFESDKAVLLLREDETQQLIVDQNELPATVNEGDILEVMVDENNHVVKANILKEETESVRQHAENLLKKILNKNKD